MQPVDAEIIAVDNLSAARYTFIMKSYRFQYADNHIDIVK